MDVLFEDLNPDALETELLVIPLRENRLEEPLLRRLDRRLSGKLRERVQKSRFTAAEGSLLLHAGNGAIPAGHVLLAGLGKEREISAQAWRTLAGRARKEAAGLGAETIAFALPPQREFARTAGALVEGALLASYRFAKYRSDNKEPPALKTMTLVQRGVRKNAALERAVRMAEASARGVALARDLVNEPPSLTTARFLAEQAAERCTGHGLEVEVWDKRKIEENQLRGLLAVNRGSVEEPRFIIIRYRPPRRARKRVFLIGKGITFDSGGLSLKSAKSMETMKIDMSGAAAILGAMSVVPEIQPAAEIVAYLPCTDNLPSGSAQKPGDVIRYLNGKTAEVINTDAEGRLILADGLALAAREKPDCMITIATLTGACVVALGTEVAGLFGNDRALVQQMLRSAEAAGERFWELPLVKEYREEIKSSVADIKNVGGRHGGAIIAALFLQEFVDNLPWLHLDIAGPAYTDKDRPLCPRGGTGFGVMTLLKFLSSFA